MEEGGERGERGEAQARTVDFFVPTPRREKLTRVVGGIGKFESTIKTINCA